MCCADAPAYASHNIWLIFTSHLFISPFHIFVRRLYTIHIYIYRVYFCGLFVLIFVTVHRAAPKSLTEIYLWYWKLTPRNHVVNNINIYTECSSTRNLCAFNSKPKNQIAKRIKQIIVNQSVSQSINVIFARHLVGLDWILEILLRSLTKHSNLFNIFLDNCMHRRFWSFVASYFKLHQSNDKLLHTHPHVSYDHMYLMTLNDTCMKSQCVSFCACECVCLVKHCLYRRN